MFALKKNESGCKNVSITEKIFLIIAIKTGRFFKKIYEFIGDFVTAILDL